MSTTPTAGVVQATPTTGDVGVALDTIATTARTHADTIAERAAAIGTPPDGRGITIVATSQLPQLDAGVLRDDTVIEKVEDILTTTAAGIHRAIDVTADDPITQDIPIATGHDIEQQTWLLRSQR